MVQVEIEARIRKQIRMAAGLREIGSGLPPGFRFHPRDEELVFYYLCNKVANGGSSMMVEVDLHTHEPWELPEVAKLGVEEWYFFSFRDRKYATGGRANRATKSGYWKATGKDRVVHNPKGSFHGMLAGMRKTLVFYHGRAPNGIKSSWVMHEFRLQNPHHNSQILEDWVLCRVFHKKSPHHGQADYGREDDVGCLRRTINDQVCDVDDVSGASTDFQCLKPTDDHVRGSDDHFASLKTLLELHNCSSGSVFSMDHVGGVAHGLMDTTTGLDILAGAEEDDLEGIFSLEFQGIQFDGFLGGGASMSIPTYTR